MSGAEWPKESQRMCNGASGQVPTSFPFASPAMDSGFLHLDWLNMKSEPGEAKTPEQLAGDVAERILSESLDAAQHVISHFQEDRQDVLTLAKIHAQVAAVAYAVHELTKALHEVAPEIAGAISEAGTDIGAGIFGAIEQAFKATNENQNNT